MSVMYFFTSLLGRVGSFLMLIFMVIQLAGSVGTYPLEISGDFVPYLHGLGAVYLYGDSLSEYHQRRGEH